MAMPGAVLSFAWQASTDGRRGVSGEHLPEQNTLRLLQEGQSAESVDETRTTGSVAFGAT